jgi:hypothetical protein
VIGMRCRRSSLGPVTSSAALYPTETLRRLLRGPLCGRMLSDVEVHDASALVGEHDEDKEHTQCGGRDEKKVAGDDVVDMIIEKRLPGR